MNLSRLIFRSVSCLVWAGASLGALAQTASQDPALHAQQLEARAHARDVERADIAAQRRDIQARKAQAEQECWQKFAVENCLRAVRAQARAQDDGLRNRELSLSAEERQEKATERLRAIELKQREKQVPVPVTAMPRDGSGALQTEAQLQQSQAERQSSAQQRAAAQAARVRSHEAAQAERVQSQAQDQAKAAQALQDKQKAAQARRESKARDIAEQRGQPLPIPQGLPQP